MSDQFTRWICAKCGEDGIDSWNKAIFDGPGLDPDNIPDPFILGGECWRCWWPCTVCYTAPWAAPRAIYGPFPDGNDRYAYEDAAFGAWNTDPHAGIALQPATSRDADWSRGCLAAKGQLQ